MCLNELKHGYVIPFENKRKKVHEEPNNQSIINETSFANQAILYLTNLGVVEFSEEKPYRVSPLTVSYKTRRDGSIKIYCAWTDQDASTNA